MDKAILKVSLLDEMDVSPEKDEPPAKKSHKKQPTAAARAPWPAGLPLKGEHSSLCCGAALMVMQFLRSFGKSSCLKDVGAHWTEKWVTLTVEQLLSDVAEKEPPEYLVGLITCLLTFVQNRDVSVISA